MKNQALKNLIRNSRIRQYEIAQALGISEFTFSRWLRSDLSEEREKQIRDAIDTIMGGGGFNAETSRAE